MSCFHRQNTEKQKLLIFDKLEQVNVWYFCLGKVITQVFTIGKDERINSLIS